MTVGEVVSACQDRVASVQRRNDALRRLVESYRGMGLTYVQAVQRTADEVRDALLQAGFTDAEVRGLGVSVGNIRAVVERS